VLLRTAFAIDDSAVDSDVLSNSAWDVDPAALVSSDRNVLSAGDVLAIVVVSTLEEISAEDEDIAVAVSVSVSS
jgi:hypothetical protein